MSRGILLMLFGVLVWSCTASNIFAQAAPASAVRVRGRATNQNFQRGKQKKIKELQSKLQSDDLNEVEIEKATAEFKEVVESMFDDETKLMKMRVADMQAKLDERAAGREKLIQDRIEELLNPPKPGEIAFEVKDVKKNADGSSIASVVFFRTERRTRTVNVIQMVAEQRTRNVNGTDQIYTVQVPISRQQEQEYMVNIPVGKENVPIPAGADVKQTVKKFTEEGGDF